MYSGFVLVLLFPFVGVSSCDSYTPILIWHGLSDHSAHRIINYNPKTNGFVWLDTDIIDEMVFYEKPVGPVRFEPEISQVGAWFSTTRPLIFLYLVKESNSICLDASEYAQFLYEYEADTCCGQTVAGQIQNNLTEYLPGIHIVSLQIGNSTAEDYLNSLFMNPDVQVATACNVIKADPLFANGYNAIGHSQASQFLRAVAQRCPEPRMKNLISLAGQHQGVYGIPHCENVIFCEFLRDIASDVAYIREVQEILPPAAYWHDPLDRDAYIEGNIFLVDINNEKTINQTYVSNLQQLENFVMVKYDNDRTVKPTESSWFGFYKHGQAVDIETLQESELYISDRLGLKQMDSDGKLHFLSVPWSHSSSNGCGLETILLISS